MPATRLRTAVFWLIALVATAPAWIARYPPIQDLPYHLAAIRVIHSLHDPAYGLDAFTLTLSKTQYLAYYLTADALSYGVGVQAANTVLVCAYLAGTLLGMRALLRALGKDERASLFVLPLLVNRLFLLGLFPFLLAIPVMLFALAATVKLADRATVGRAVTLGLLSLGLFFLHVVPFAVFAIGFAALLLTRPLRSWPVLALPLAPSAAAAIWWLRATPAGQMMREGSDPPRPFGASVGDLHTWFTSGITDGHDAVLLPIVLACACLATVLGRRRHPWLPREIALAAVPLACAVLYFVTPPSQGFIWPIAGRFAVLAAIMLVPLVRLPERRAGHALTGGVLALSAFSLVVTCRTFLAFERDEAMSVAEAIATIPPRKRVAAVLNEQGSGYVTTSPFLHFGSYYQLEKGGVVAFTFAGYPHWPFSFKPGSEPQGRQRFPVGWEWRRHSAAELEGYYDYVITRGFTAEMKAPYRLQWLGAGGWKVWRRTEAAKSGVLTDASRVRGPAR